MSWVRELCEKGREKAKGIRYGMLVPPLLEIQNLTKTYPNGAVALRGVSFKVDRGEFLVIIGRSGSGKSTLLRCLNRLQDPSAGSIRFNEELVSDAGAKKVQQLRRRMALIFQHYNLISRHSVLKNVLLGRLGFTSSISSIFGFFAETDKKMALAQLSRVGILEKARVRVDHLSGGQQQRVAIARALMQEPEILLADEPVASLDPATCRTVMSYLKTVNQELGLTIVCNLHQLDLVREFATRVVALKDGLVVYNGSPLEISNELYEKIYGTEA